MQNLNFFFDPVVQFNIHILTFPILLFFMLFEIKHQTYNKGRVKSRQIQKKSLQIIDLQAFNTDFCGAEGSRTLVQL